MPTVISAPEPDLTSDQLIERARKLIPTLRERAPEADQLRTVPAASIEDFKRAGFYRTLQPKRFGGYQFGHRTFCEVMKNIARGCPSSGWVLCLTSAHTFHMSAFPEAGQIEMYGDDGDFRAPLIFAPQGKAVPVDGGYQVSGRWDYNSGGEHANWLVVGATVPGDDPKGPPSDVRMTFLRRDDYDIFDNWHVMGMRGTGSKQAVVDNVFVPAQRTVSQPAWFKGEAPGYGVHDDPFYRTPPMEMFCSELSSICVGVGEAAIDAFVDRVMTKRSAFPPFYELRHDHNTQRILGRARAHVDAADALLDCILRTHQGYTDDAAAGKKGFSAESRRRVMMMTQQIEQNVRQAMDLLIDGSGTSAVRQGEPMERLYRDFATIRTHYIFGADRTAENWGATALGLDEYSPF